MNQVSIASRSAPRSRALVDRVQDAAASLGCRGVWAKASGPHVLLGRDGEDAFARVTPIGPGAFGLAFRSVEGEGNAALSWDAVLLIDTLADVVEHALIGEGALDLPDAGYGGARSAIARVIDLASAQPAR
jgi:hypothetical protein